MVSYRLANKSDYPEINAFHNRIYGTNRTMEQFLWEFHDGPHGQSIYVIAEDQGKVVGTNCVIPIILINGNRKEYRTGKSEDTLVDPDYRGQRIFYKIYDFLFEKCLEGEIEFVWGFTSAIKPFKKIGFDVPFNQKQSLIVNKPFKSYRFLVSLNPKNKLTDKIKILGLSVLSKMRGVLKLQSKGEKFEIRSAIDQELDVMDLILENLSNESLFAIKQDVEFQKWRLYENPNYHKVHAYSVFKNDELKAQIVFNSDRNGVAYNCQSLFASGLSVADKVSILKSVTKKLFKEGVILVRNWHFDTNNLNLSESEVYELAGYTVLDRGIGFVWKVIGQEQLNASDFYLSRIATQGIT